MTVTGLKVDGYCHCGPDRYGTKAELRKTLRTWGISRCVLVQHFGQYDNTYIQRTVQESNGECAGVMLVDLESPEPHGPVTHIERWLATGAFRGIRLHASSLLRHEHVWSYAAAHGLPIVTVADPVQMPSISPYVSQWLDRNTPARLVLSHMGSPNLKTNAWLQGYESILALSRHHNVSVLCSAVGLFHGLNPSMLKSVIDQLYEHFGPTRMIWGSDYPATTSGRTYGLYLRRLLGLLPESDHHLVFADNAIGLWFK
ncbi:MAG: amidohydrolase [Phycisphaeraceae bacterium]|nr:amidohydrolase [Phycisphaeraceae bacterium]